MTLASTYQFKYPPEQQLCLKHKLSTRIWKGIKDQKTNLQICQCCDRKIGQEDVPNQCCYYSSQMSFLGVGVPLFFSFLRYSIFLLIILSLVFCVFGLYTNIVSKNCQEETECRPNIFNTLSIINKKSQQNFMSIQNYILLTFVVICLFIFQIFRYRFRKVVEQIDEFCASPSDYSVILKRLPEQSTQRDILQFIEYRRGYLDQQQKIATNNLQVQQIIMSYDLTYLNKQKSLYLKTFKTMIKQGQSSQFQRPQLPHPNKTASIAVIVFSKQQSKQLIIQQPKFVQRAIHYFFSPCAPLSDDRIKGQRVSVQRAPEPDDIMWNNANVTIKQKICRKLVLGLFSSVLLTTGGLTQYGLAVLQRDIQDQTQKILIGTLASVVVTFTNLILQNFLIYTTFWQRMSTYTQYTDVLTFKLVFQQFLNSGVFIIAANILANYQTFNLQTNLSQTITQIMFLNALTPNISTLIMYRCDISGRLWRYFCLNKKWIIYTQLQANQLYVLPQPTLPQKYSYIIKTVWLTAFYAPFVPVVVPISIIGLVMNYFVQKYLFGSSYSAPNMISTQVNNSCVQFFQYVPLILSIGQLLIYFYFKKFNFNSIPVNWAVPIYLSIGISFINLILPMSSINKKLCRMTLDLSKQPTYSQAQNQFQVTYEITNPAYQSKRKRLGDLNLWKMLFGHSPLNYMTDYKNIPMTDRLIQVPFNNYYNDKY